MAAKRQHPTGTAGSRLDVGVGRASEQPKAVSRGRDVGPKGRARVDLTVVAMADRHAARLNFRLKSNGAAMALAFNFQLISPDQADAARDAILRRHRPRPATTPCARAPSKRHPVSDPHRARLARVNALTDGASQGSCKASYQWMS